MAVWVRQLLLEEAAFHHLASIEEQQQIIVVSSSVGFRKLFYNPTYSSPSTTSTEKRPVFAFSFVSNSGKLHLFLDLTSRTGALILPLASPIKVGADCLSSCALMSLLHPSPSVDRIQIIPRSTSHRLVHRVPS